MARKTATITISEGRDKGKTFRLTEPSAIEAERWALRVLLALGKGGVEIPPEVLQLGAAGIIYAAGSQVLRMPSRTALRLADELMAHVKRIEARLDARELVENDIEEVETRLKLKFEVLKLTYGFFLPAAPQTSAVESGTGESNPSMSQRSSPQ